MIILRRACKWIYIYIYITLFLQIDLTRSNTVVPKAIQWKDISLPEDWILEGAAPLELPQPPQPNVQIKTLPNTHMVKSNCLSIDTLQVPYSQKALPLPVQ